MPANRGAVPITVMPSGGPVNGVLAVPGGKSTGNRAILLAAFADGESRLRGLSDSDDTRAALAAVQSLGVACHIQGSEARIIGNQGRPAVHRAEIPVASSGTVGRFLPGLLAAAPEGAWRIVSTPQLAKRPLDALVDALKKWGARLGQPVRNASFPLVVHGGGLSGGEVGVSVAASSQFASGLLMAAPFCREPATVIVKDLDPDESYLDLTLGLMRRFGIEFGERPADGARTVTFPAEQMYRATQMDIPADANTAVPFLVLAALTGGTVRIVNLDPTSRQPGIAFLDVLARMGATVTRSGEVSVTGNPLPLRGGFTVDLRAMSEMALILGVLAVFADAPVAMTNLRHIRGHETDRIKALCDLLAEAGVVTEEKEDGVTVFPQPAERIRSAVINPRDDHRVAMAFAVLGAAANGITIENPSCVGKTYPGFFDSLAELGIRMC